jgi:NADH:ubiquinone oxidoreductase subunit F (NADH-binding)
MKWILRLLRFVCCRTLKNVVRLQSHLDHNVYILWSLYETYVSTNFNRQFEEGAAYKVIKGIYISSWAVNCQYLHVRVKYETTESSVLWNVIYIYPFT